MEQIILTRITMALKNNGSNNNDNNFYNTNTFDNNKNTSNSYNPNTFGTNNNNYPYPNNNSTNYGSNNNDNNYYNTNSFGNNNTGNNNTYQNSYNSNTYGNKDPLQKDMFPNKNVYEEPKVSKKDQLIIKLKEKLIAFNNNTTQEIEREMKETNSISDQGNMMNQEKNKILSEMSKFQAFKENLKDEQEKLNRWITENDIDPNNLDIDKYGTPNNNFEQQALDLTSEIHSIDDLQYCLDRALQEGVIPLKVYLKQMRSISSKQFKKKALLEKVMQELNKRGN